MATYKAIAAATEGVVHLLRTGYRPEDFDNHDLEFKVYTAEDFANPMQAGVSLFLYRIVHSGVHRTPSGRLGTDGQRQKPQLPLELHFLLTAWGREASLQNTIAGWMMRTLEDTPTLPPAVLNATWPQVFQSHEAVDVVLGEIRTEDLFHLWNVLHERGYQISIPYVARVVQIESGLTVSAGMPVRRRSFDLEAGPEG